MQHAVDQANLWVLTLKLADIAIRYLPIQQTLRPDLTCIGIARDFRVSRLPHSSQQPHTYRLSTICLWTSLDRVISFAYRTASSRMMAITPSLTAFRFARTYRTSQTAKLMKRPA